MQTCKERAAAFTLIEMMVVVALVGILMAGVFKLMNAAAETSKRAKTIARLQKLENALAGYHAAYGSYPPVQIHEPPDPFLEFDGKNYKNTSKLTAENAKRAANSRPVAFEFPVRSGQDAALNAWFAARGKQVVSANENPGSFSSDTEAWKDVKLFKFGLLSFLLPRLYIIGEYDVNGKMTRGPDVSFFKKKQWTANNPSTDGNFATQYDNELAACAHWLPNLKDLTHGGPEVLGVKTGDGTLYYVDYGSTGLRLIRVLDGWDRDIFYYSAPPYQSYRLWSAGANGNTFPPDYPMSSLKASDRAMVSKWIKDDIVGFDR